MDEEHTTALNKASVVVLTTDYREKVQEELWDMRKTREDSLIDYSKRFRALVRQEYTLTRLHVNSPMSEGALCRLCMRGLPYEWQNKYDARERIYSTVAALVPFYERSSNASDASSVETSMIMPDIMDNATILTGAIHRTQQQHRSGFRGRGRGNGNGQYQGGGTHSNVSNNTYCTFHRTTTHKTQACRFASFKKSTNNLTNSVANEHRLTNNKIKEHELSNAIKGSDNQVVKSIFSLSSCKATPDSVANESHDHVREW
ncbi:hypothetical protein PHMEG_00016772 [Phytophthora megakarya]|uniref:Retrotransposon gag domain-containing protein n=1 Tax=Phytophthora megakarya TaxID=4795 RepID=A0A225VY64_9STRA|nr:hypothetical protein PHMEG_00016772 [Phytophthora megakarya]